MGRGVFANNGDADWEWLSSNVEPDNSSKVKKIRTVDLFAGCGGLSLGVKEWCRRSGLEHIVEFASEWNEGAMAIFRKNFDPIFSSCEDIDSILSPSLNRPLTEVESVFLDANPNVRNPDLLIGGPPCQDGALRARRAAAAHGRHSGDKKPRDQVRTGGRHRRYRGPHQERRRREAGMQQHRRTLRTQIGAASASTNRSTRSSTNCWSRAALRLRMRARDIGVRRRGEWRWQKIAACLSSARRAFGRRCRRRQRVRRADS